MNVVTTTWQQLVRRRLWPVALLLVAALAAVPFVLASSPEPVVPQADPAPVVTEDDELAEPVVAKVAAEERTRRRRVLGARKDPFEPAPAPKKKKATSTKAKQTSTKQADTPTESKGSTPTTTSGGGGTTVPSVPPVTEPSVRKPPAGSVTVRFGDATQEDLPAGWLTKLRPLPDPEEPLLVYMGLTKDGKKAKFLVDATLTPTGDGTCKPHPASCETILLSRGETEFFDVIDPESGEPTAQYQLDLVAIN
ncbi:MAG TPA: hypothetical protein VFP78_11845 [Solirubrobacteraceae bacterium]|nr:hypothetical protein [Solirubrobacteraceae bacterium]